MPAFGIGTDILEIERMRKAIKTHGKAFINKIFTPKEQAYCLQYRDPAPQFAARFSAKESIAKALGSKIGRKVGWLDIEIDHDEAGKPVPFFSDRIKKAFDNPHIILSISHCRTYVSTVALKIHIFHF